MSNSSSFLQASTCTLSAAPSQNVCEPHYHVPDMYVRKYCIVSYATCRDDQGAVNVWALLTTNGVVCALNLHEVLS